MEEISILWTGIVPCAAFTFLITLESAFRSNVGKVRKLPLIAITLLVAIMALDLVIVNLLLFVQDESSWLDAVFFMVDTLLWAVVVTSYSLCCNGTTVFRTNYLTLKLMYFYKMVQCLHYLITTVGTELDSVGIMEKIMFLTVLILIINFVLRFKSLPDYERLEDQDLAADNSPLNRNFLQRWLLLWVFPIISIGQKRPLETDDSPELRKEETANYQHTEFSRTLNGKLMNPLVKKPVLSSIWAHYKWEMINLIGISVGSILTDMSSSLFIMVISDFLTHPEAIAYWKGFVLLFYLFVIKAAQAVLNAQQRMQNAILACHMRAGLCTVLYRKTLRSATTEFSLGEVTNLMQVDVARICDGLPFSLRIFSFPIQLTLSIAIFWWSVGWVGAVASLITLFLLFLINFGMAYMMKSVQKTLMQKKDARMKYCTELLNNIKIFKLYNWENIIAERVRIARTAEMKAQTRYIQVLTGIFFISWGSRYYVMVAMLVSMALVGQEFQAGPIFTALSIVRVIVITVIIVPNIINGFIQTQIAMDRIQKFLKTQDTQQYVATREATQAPRDTDVKIKNCNFQWEGETDEPVTALKDVNLEIQRGDIVAVVGKVGSGKTALLKAIIGSMKCVKQGSDAYVFATKNVSYCEQEAWIQNATLKDNIIYGQEFNQELYDKVIEFSQLEQDIGILPGGDQTEIGEKGINLSGGQKARVAIARAIYKQADLIIMDDPLAAVDVHVGEAIFKKCLRDFCKGKTVVLVTNGQQYLPYVDKIIVVDEGQIIETGSYNELVDIGGYFANNFLTALKRKESTAEVKTEAEDQAETDKANEKKQEARMIEAEDRERGQVSFDVYKVYIKKMGGMIFITGAMLCMICWMVVSIWSNFIISDWAGESEKDQVKYRDYYIILFTTVSMSINLFVLVRFFIMFSAGLKAARIIFNQVLNALLDAPINKFYDVTPIGRILNRISKDQAGIDQNVYMSMGGLIGQGFTALFYLGMCAATVPLSLLIIPFIVYISRKMQVAYLACSRELTRIEAISKSPIITSFGETMRGASTIRAFGFGQNFIDKNESLLNVNTKIYITLHGTNCWMSFYLEMASNLILLICAALIIGGRDYMDPGIASMALYNALGIPSVVYFMILNVSELENWMISVERTDTLSRTPGEAPRIRNKDDLLRANNWPQRGEIEFKDLMMRYRDDTDIVLKGVTVKINSMEKVGIVGRTGSGKSSLGVVLFRIVEPYRGSIHIDNEDITEVGLDILRQQISLIPQDPTLFEGTMRYNLDPFNKIDDAALIEVMKDIEFYEEGILEKEIKQNGDNLSVGQKQLVCIARALLRKTKIMLLDEATASMDYKSDEMVQKIIRVKFQDYTVLTIAHRINTILDYDKIIVMDDGIVKEFGTPQQLLDKGGIFASLAKDH